MVTTVTTDDEVRQVQQLSHQNQKQQLTKEEKQKEGFITWEYSFDLLKQMHDQQPSIVSKDGDKVTGYALVALKEAKEFHAALAGMIEKLEAINYKEKSLAAYKFYVMGQVCIDKAYRGKGLFEALYMKHKEIFKDHFDFVVTEISSSNLRSIRAHEKIGFKTIYTYKDATDDWNVVLWDWR